MRNPAEKRTARRSAWTALYAGGGRSTMSAETEITEHLEGPSWDEIVPLVYGELRAIAHRQLRCERDSHTLNTTALVHEAFLRLADQPSLRWHNEAHFFAI